MPTYQLKVETEAQFADSIENQLFNLGSLSVSYADAKDQPIYEPELGTTPLWQEVIVLALFEQKPDIDLLFIQLQQVQAELKKQALSIEPLPDKDWTRAWMEDYKPMQYGEKLWVVPHEMEPPQPEAVNLRLDPGLAFGSGTHSTTRLCLEWIAQQDLTGKTIVDFGCGSGILAIAACLMGAEKAICTDIDPQALESTQNNATDNGVFEKFELYLPEDMPKVQADVVFANILAGPLCELNETISQLCSDKGILLLSGILAEQQQQVTQCYRNKFASIESAQHEDWIRLVAKN